MDFIIPNLRLAELVAIVNENRQFFEDFLDHIREAGYANPHAFVAEPSDEKALHVIARFLNRSSGAALFDGLGRPYANATARWYFLAWLLRDAPAQRLRPLVEQAPGATMEARRAYLLNEVRKYVAPLFPNNESWSWAAISEVMLARLEGSRRSLKGTLFEAIVRRSVKAVLDENSIDLKISPNEVRILDETYDVQISGPSRSILIPIKTRETMGGGARDAVHSRYSQGDNGCGKQRLSVLACHYCGIVGRKSKVAEMRNLHLYPGEPESSDCH